MSQSPITVTYSLEEVLSRLEQKIDTLQKDGVRDLSRTVTDLKIGQAKMEAEIRGDIKALDEKVNGLSGVRDKSRTKRLEFQEFVNKGVLVGLVVAIIGGAAKLFGWVLNKTDCN